MESAWFFQDLAQHLMELQRGFLQRFRVSQAGFGIFDLAPIDAESYEFRERTVASQTPAVTAIASLLPVTQYSSQAIQPLILARTAGGSLA